VAAEVADIRYPFLKILGFQLIGAALKDSLVKIPVQSEEITGVLASGPRNAVLDGEVKQFSAAF
jgi:hypothetical protein